MHNTKEGFTLLEILLTLALFGAGVVGITGLFGYTLENSLDADYTQNAVSLARAGMEEIRNIPYAYIKSESKAQITGFPLFKRQVDVSTALANLKQVTVTIYWQFKGKEAAQ